MPSAGQKCNCFVDKKFKQYFGQELFIFTRSVVWWNILHDFFYRWKTSDTFSTMKILYTLVPSNTQCKLLILQKSKLLYQEIIYTNCASISFWLIVFAKPLMLNASSLILIRVYFSCIFVRVTENNHIAQMRFI